MTVPAYLSTYILVSGVVIVAAVLLGVNLALVRARWPDGERRATMRATTAVLVGWFVATTVLGYLGAFQGAPERLPTIQYGLVPPILLGVLLLWRSPAFGRLVDAVPQPWIIGVQLYRALGVIFLLLYASDHLPGLFALPAGIGDVATGLAAPFVAMAYARDPHRNAGRVLFWNLFGLADLALAVAMGFLTSPSPLQLFAFDHPNLLISAYPLVSVPVFAVPLAIVLHIVSLTKLAGLRARTGHGSAMQTSAL